MRMAEPMGGDWRPSPSVPPSLFRDFEFLKLWSAETISVVGSQFSQVAIPVLAVQVLVATTFEVGVLSALQLLPFPLFGLLVGVWADRRRKRPTMIAADLARMALLGLIPLSAVLLHVSMPLLYFIVFFVGLAQAFFDISYQAYLPYLVRSDQLVEGNGRLTTSRSAASVLGPFLAGVAINLVGAPMAILGDVFGYLGSASFLSWIRRREPMPKPRTTSVLHDVREGLGVVLKTPNLRSIAFCTGTANFFNNAFQVVALIFMLRLLGFSAAEYGSVLAVGGAGAVVAALVVMRFVSSIGVGRSIVVGSFLSGITFVLVYFAEPAYAFPLMAAVNFVGFFGVVIYNVAQVSYRQALVPLELQGRMNASIRVLVWGPIPVGAFLGGVMGTLLGIRESVLITAIGMSLAFLWVFFSPVKSIKGIPRKGPEDERKTDWRGMGPVEPHGPI